MVSLPIEPRSYKVKTPNGQIYRRNRYHITIAPPQIQQQPVTDDDDDDWPIRTSDNHPQANDGETNGEPTEQAQRRSTRNVN